MKCQKRILPEDDPVLSPESDCIPGRGSSQFYLNVSLLREETGGLQFSLATLLFILYFICLNR